MGLMGNTLLELQSNKGDVLPAHKFWAYHVVVLKPNKADLGAPALRQGVVYRLKGLGYQAPQLLCALLQLPKWLPLMSISPRCSRAEENARLKAIEAMLIRQFPPSTSDDPTSGGSS